MSEQFNDAIENKVIDMTTTKKIEKYNLCRDFSIHKDSFLDAVDTSALYI